MGLAPELDNFYVVLRLHLGHRRVRRRRLGDGELDRRRRSGHRPVAVRRAPLRRAALGASAIMAERASRATAATTTSTGRSTSLTSAAARAAARSTRRCAAADAVFGSSSAGSGRTGSRPPGRAAIDTPSFERGPTGSTPVGAEHRAVRERVALIDQSSFSKYEVARPRRVRAAAASRRQRPRPAGRRDRLHAALQRARRHRGRRHDHAARARTASTS